MLLYWLGSIWLQATEKPSNTCSYNWKRRGWMSLVEAKDCDSVLSAPLLFLSSSVYRLHFQLASPVPKLFIAFQPTHHNVQRKRKSLIVSVLLMRKILPKRFQPTMLLGLIFSNWSQSCGRVCHTCSHSVSLEHSSFIWTRLKF